MEIGILAAVLGLLFGTAAIVIPYPRNDAVLP